MPMTLHPTSLADRTWVEQLDALLGPPEAGRDQYRRYPDQYKRKDFYRAKRGTNARSAVLKLSREAAVPRVRATKRVNDFEIGRRPGLSRGPTHCGEAPGPHTPPNGARPAPPAVLSSPALVWV